MKRGSAGELPGSTPLLMASAATVPALQDLIRHRREQAAMAHHCPDSAFPAILPELPWQITSRYRNLYGVVAMIKHQSSPGGGAERDP